MKLFLANTLAVILAISAFGQNATNDKSVCDSQTAEKISSRGIKLGMSEKETLDGFAENGKLTTVYRNNYNSIEAEYQKVVDSLQKQAAQKYGFSSLLLAPRDKNKFDGIAHYDRGFIDNRLAFYKGFLHQTNLGKSRTIHQKNVRTLKSVGSGKQYREHSISGQVRRL